MPESTQRNQEEQLVRPGDGDSTHGVHAKGADERTHQAPQTPHTGPQQSNAGELVAASVAKGQDALQSTVSQVHHEQRPRRLAIRYGRQWLVLYGIVLAAVVALAILVHSTNVLPVDVSIERELQENRTPLVFVSMVAVSWLGYEPQVTVIFLLALGALLVLRLRLEAIFLVLSELGDLTGGLVKIVVARARPSSNLVDVVTHLNSYSFPSGHTVHYTVFYGFLAYIVATNFRPHWIRQIFLAVCIGLILLVGLSRVYLGEHWPTDVLAGYLIGGLFLVPLIGAYLWAKERVVIITHRPFLVWRSEPTSRNSFVSHPDGTQRAQSERR